MVWMLIRPGQLLWPVSDLTSTKTTMYTYSGFTSSGINKIIAGPVSNNLYYFDGIGSPSQAVIRKIGLDGTTYWYASISGSSWLKSAAIDRLEQRAYIAIYAVPLEIVQFSTNDGSITGAAQL